MKKTFFEIYKRSEKEFKEEELWPYYFKKRYLEFLSFYEIFKDEKTDHVLEIGCGLGYYSVFLSNMSKELVATDLDEESNEDHAIGLNKTRDFTRKFNCSNIKITPASAESIPFEDSSFDFVFSSHVLEHVPNKELAISEIYRVLKPNGLFICITPSRADRFYAFFNNHIYLFGRVLYHLFRKRNANNTVTEGKSMSEKVTANKNNIFFPQVHGAYSSYFEEFRKWSFSNWKKLLLTNTGFTLVSHTSSELNPIANLTYYISPWVSVNMLAMSRKIDSILGTIPLIKTLGVNSILVIRKPKL